MRKAGKNVVKARKAVEARPYALQEAVPLLQKVKFAKFDETVEVTMRLGVDPKHADQMVRGTVVLPHGLGKSKKVLVITSGEKLREAQQAGADFVGGEDMVEKITKENWTDFDALIDGFDAPDPLTVLVRWASPYIAADGLFTINAGGGNTSNAFGSGSRR